MNGPETKIEPAICQCTPGWLIGKPQCSAAECPAWFCQGIEAAVAASSQAGQSVMERLGDSPSVLLQHLGSCCLCHRHFCPEDHHLPVLSNRRSPHSRKGREGLEAGWYLLSPPAWAGEFPSQPTAQLQRLEWRGGSPAGAVAFIQRRYLCKW